MVLANGFAVAHGCANVVSGIEMERRVCRYHADCVKSVNFSDAMNICLSSIDFLVFNLCDVSLG